MGLPLGALLTVVFLITALAVVIAVHVTLSRRKEKITAVEYEVEYEIVGPPRLPLRPDVIPTDVNVAYASTNFIDS